MRRHVTGALAACGLLALAACGDDDDGAVSDAGAERDGGEKSSAGSGGNNAADSGGRVGAAGSGGRASAAGRGGSGGGKASEAEGEQAVEIKFKAKFGSEDLACGEWYTNAGLSKARVTVQDFRWFVEEIRLLKADGSEVEMQFDDRPPFQTKDVALLDFTDGTGRCEGGGDVINTTITGKVPKGEYTGIVFVNGVPEALNHANITEAKPPLQDTTIYWSWRSGYRFIVTELSIEEGAGTVEDAGMGDPTSKFVHIGSGGCSDTPPNYTCTRPNRPVIRLESFDPATNTITADMAKVYEKVDLLSQDVQCHGMNPVCAPAYDAFGVSFETGMPTDTQTVFGVE